jgi:hypothetical protein
MLFLRIHCRIVYFLANYNHSVTFSLHFKHLAVLTNAYLLNGFVGLHYLNNFVITNSLLNLTGDSHKLYLSHSFCLIGINQSVRICNSMRTLFFNCVALIALNYMRTISDRSIVKMSMRQSECI